MDVGCYCINVMRHMTGEEPDDGSAIARIGLDSKVDEYVVGTLKFPSGALGHFDCGLRTHITHAYEIRGNQGRIVVEQGFVMEPLSDTTIRHWRGDQYEEITIPATDHYQVMAEDFAQTLLEGQPLKFPLEDAVDTMRVIDFLKARWRRA
jgi:predicted dehydrogenase